jgi:hypothetical protein
MPIATFLNDAGDFLPTAKEPTTVTERMPEPMLSLLIRIAALSGALPITDAASRDAWTIADASTPQMRAKALLQAKLNQRRRARAIARAKSRPPYSHPAQPDFGPFGWLFGIGTNTKFSAAQQQQRTF